MRLLIDTAFDTCQVGLWQDGALHGFLTRPGEARHDVVLAPLVEQLLKEHDKSVSDLTGVAVVTGPGRFTSLRVGIALARALVLPQRLPLVGVATGAVLQRLIHQVDNPAWLVMVKRGEVFAQTPAMADPVLVTLDRLPVWLSDQQINKVAAIGAGVPMVWSEILPAQLDCHIVEALPLPLIGQVADGLFQHPSHQPVRPFYGTSTGAWDQVLPKTGS